MDLFVLLCCTLILHLSSSCPLLVQKTLPADRGVIAALLAPPSISSLLQQQQQNQKQTGASISLDLLLLARERVLHELSVAAEAELLEVYLALAPANSTYQFNIEVRARCLSVMSIMTFATKSCLFSYFSAQHFIFEYVSCWFCAGGQQAGAAKRVSAIPDRAQVPAARLVMLFPLL